MFASKDVFLKSSGGGYTVSRSVRLRNSASAYLNRTTTSSVTNNKIFTYSMWVKRGIINDGSAFETLIGGGPTNADTFGFGSGTNAAGDYLQLRDSGGGTFNLLTTQLFRDPSSWYHFVLAVDTTQATAANRVKIYLNGVQITSFSTATYPAQNYVFDWNTTSTVCAIGRRSGGNASWYYDGYFAEMYFVDGQQLTPSSFGAISTNGVWQPTAYTGTYGTNGFYLKFNSYATAAALGTDSSGNGNTWTVNNISVTAGVTYDSMTDVPTLTSATVANYATGNPVYADASVSATYTNGNLTWSCPNTGSGKATISATTGKFYWEAIYLTNAFMTGVADAASVGRYNNSILYQSDGTKGINGTFTSYGATYTTGDVIGVALDLTGGTVTFYKNNSSQGSISLSLASITNATAIIVGGGGSANTGNWNFGQQPFTYTPPSGFVALNTYNLSTPTIPNGAVYMAATTYTGTGAALTVANTVNGTNFQPDFVWTKSRSNGYSHKLFDSVRGVYKQLNSDSTAAESSDVNLLTAFGSSGFSIGNDTGINGSGSTFVAWQWKANGTGVSNTSGSITSTVSANTTAGFSIATYTGTGSAATVGHGLGVAPSMVIVKQRNATADWVVKHVSLSSNDSTLILDNTSASTVYSPSVWNNTAPTSTVFSIGTNSAINTNTNTYVAYVFAAVAGYSAFGSYTGNGSTDGPFVFLGFRPRFILMKRTDAVSDWRLHDTTRAPYNVDTIALLPNSSAAEDTGANAIDELSNGFKCRDSGAFNTSGATYIYMCFAENPFKYSLAR